MKQSNCCQEPVEVKGSVTKYYICKSCKEACDLHSNSDYKFNNMPQENIKENIAINPSNDKSRSPKTRIADFMGKYYVNLNGVVPNNIPEITEEHTQEIIEFVVRLCEEETKKQIKKREDEIIKLCEKEKFGSPSHLEDESFDSAYKQGIDQIINLITNK